MANIKGLLGAAGMAAIAGLAMSTAALADEERQFGYSITLSGTSDYIFRGLSLNGGEPAFQPFVEFTYGIAYLDFWGSNAGADDRNYAPYEVDVYAGIRPVTGPISWDLGVLYYSNPQSSFSSHVDYVELKIAASYTLMTNLTVGLTGYYTPDQGFAVGETETIEGNASYTLPKFAMFDPSIGGVLGWSHGTDGTGSYWGIGRDDYTYWNAGLKLAVDKYWMDFRYWDTDLTKAEESGSTDAAARFVFSAGVNLP
jgi:uncharacterized protein (TIGR02001 family)